MNKLLRQIQVLYQDQHILVVDKPAGLLTLPDRFVRDKPNLLDKLRQDFDEIFVVHRLDRETSGVLVFARDADSHAALSRQFEAREVEKVYLALVSGRIAPPEGTIDKPIGPHPSGDGRMIVAPRGKAAITHYKTLQLYRGYSWVELRIETGRTHQIRVHLAALGYPLAVDPLYGKEVGIYLSAFKKDYRPSKNRAEQPLIERVPLHAAGLRLTHPATEANIHVEAPLPKDLRAVINQLDRWGV
jgi:23S rRNA pseudouridine1911/1915/1917 synthase